MTQRTRRKIAVALKAMIALEAPREQATVAEPARRYQVHPNMRAAGRGAVRRQSRPPPAANYADDVAMADLSR